MGQQQLLLVVLGIIIVGVAVIVGINLFNANARENAKSNMINIAIATVTAMYEYYLKPKAFGGGGRNTMVGWLPPNLGGTPLALSEWNNNFAEGENEEYRIWCHLEPPNAGSTLIFIRIEPKEFTYGPGYPSFQIYSTIQFGGTLPHPRFLTQVFDFID